MAAEMKPKHSTSRIRSRDEGTRSRDFTTNEHKLRGKRGGAAFGLVHVSQQLYGADFNVPQWVRQTETAMLTLPVSRTGAANNCSTGLDLPDRAAPVRDLRLLLAN